MIHVNLQYILHHRTVYCVKYMYIILLFIFYATTLISRIGLNVKWLPLLFSNLILIVMTQKLVFSLSTLSETPTSIQACTSITVYHVVTASL